MSAGVHGDYKALRSCNSVYKDFIVHHLLVLTQWKKTVRMRRVYCFQAQKPSLWSTSGQVRQEPLSLSAPDNKIF